MPESLSRRHARTLERIFATQTPANIRWGEFVALVEAVGGDLEERAGSRVAVDLQERTLVVHRPHPRPEIQRSTVRDIRDFFRLVGLTP
jgi:hypothetical protein